MISATLHPTSVDWVFWACGGLILMGSAVVVGARRIQIMLVGLSGVLWATACLAFLLGIQWGGWAMVVLGGIPLWVLPAAVRNFSGWGAQSLASDTGSARFSGSLLALALGLIAFFCLIQSMNALTPSAPAARTVPSASSGFGGAFSSIWGLPIGMLLLLVVFLWMGRRSNRPSNTPEP